MAHAKRVLGSQCETAFREILDRSQYVLAAESVPVSQA